MYVCIVLMCVDCVLATPRIVQADPGRRTLPEVVLSQQSSQFVRARFPNHAPMQVSRPQL
jgi:hypothetical protein